MREPSSGKRDLLIRRQRSNPRNAPRAVKARYQPVAVRAARHDDGIGVPLGEGLQKAERRICGGFVLPFVDAIDKEKQALIVIRFSHRGDQVKLVLPAKPSLDRVDERALILIRRDELGPKGKRNPYRQIIRHALSPTDKLRRRRKHVERDEAEKRALPAAREPENDLVFRGDDPIFERDARSFPSRPLLDARCRNRRIFKASLGIILRNGWARLCGGFLRVDVRLFRKIGRNKTFGQRKLPLPACLGGRQAENARVHARKMRCVTRRELSFEVAEFRGG